MKYPSQVKEVIIVDDEQDICNLVSEILKDEGYKTRSFTGSIEAMRAINDRLPDVILFDIWLKGSSIDGLRALEVLKARYPAIPVIMISGHGNLSTAIKSLMMGAYDYIEKPFSEERIKVVVKKAIESTELKKENEALRFLVGEDDFFMGKSGAVNSLSAAILRVAPTSSRVMIVGESGSGKELAAKAIHKKSRFANSPFMVLRSSLTNKDNIEEMLFGIESANLMEPIMRKIGLLEKVINGTLYIDEISDLPLDIQAKLVNVLQNQKFSRVGSTKEIAISTRFIASSSVDLEEEIEGGRLRKDLFYRLNVIPIKVPSLSDRAEDIPDLCNMFVNKFCDFMKKPYKCISPDAMAIIQSYSWPGNIRQLKNVMERLVIMNPGVEVIMHDHIPDEIMSDNPFLSDVGSNDVSASAHIISLPLKEAREEFEKQYLKAQLTRFGGNISKTARFIQMERSALHRKLKILKVVK